MFVCVVMSYVCWMSVVVCMACCDVLPDVLSVCCMVVFVVMVISVVCWCCFVAPRLHVVLKAPLSGVVACWPL